MLLSSGVEQWACELLLSIHSTLRQHITTSPAAGVSGGVGDTGGQPFSLEETARSQVTQVSAMALYFQWCRECEHALLQCRYDRRALPGARTKFNNWSVNKLVSLLMKNAWKVVDEGMSPLQRASVEALTTVSYSRNLFNIVTRSRCFVLGGTNFSCHIPFSSPFGSEMCWMTFAVVN